MRPGKLTVLLRMLGRRKIAEGVLVEILSKPECHLCEAAKEKLQRLQRKYGFQLLEINVAESSALLAEFGTRIPLIRVNGAITCKYTVDEIALKQKFLRFAAARKSRLETFKK